MNDSDDTRTPINPEPAKPSEPGPIPFNDSDNSGRSGVSHKPLSIGGGNSNQAPKVELAKPDIKKADKKIASSEGDRINSVKTFYTKLHSGSIDYIDEVINDWLKANPDVLIKKTNTVTGEVQGKKTEPNIIVTIWY